MGYLKSIEATCKCGRRATVQLYNDVNAPIGTYCKRCGDAALKQFEERK